MSPHIKAWLRSYFRFGFGLIPVGEGNWLDPPVTQSQGSLILSHSYWWPIGGLYIIAPSKRDELFRRMRKGKFARTLLKLLVGVTALAPLLEASEMPGVKYDAGLVIVIFGLAAMSGMFVPAAVFGKRYRRFVRTGMTRVHPISKAARAFWVFNLAFLALTFVYGFVMAAMDIAAESAGGEETTSLAGGVVEESVLSWLRSPSGIGQVLLVPVKAIGSSLLLFVVSWVSLLVGGAPIDTQFEIVATLGLPVVFVAVLVWSYHYFIWSERQLATG